MQIKKALTRLRGCAGWSVPLLFVNPEGREFISFKKASNWSIQQQKMFRYRKCSYTAFVLKMPLTDTITFMCIFFITSITLVIVYPRECVLTCMQAVWIYITLFLMEQSYLDPLSKLFQMKNVQMTRRHQL